MHKINSLVNESGNEYLKQQYFMQNYIVVSDVSDSSDEDSGLNNISEEVKKDVDRQKAFGLKFVNQNASSSGAI